MNDLEHLFVSPEQATLDASLHPLHARGDWWSGLGEETQLVRSRQEEVERRRAQHDAHATRKIRARQEREAKLRDKPHRYAHVKSVADFGAVGPVGSGPAEAGTHGGQPLLADAIQKSYTAVAVVRQDTVHKIESAHQYDPSTSPLSPENAAALLGPNRFKVHPAKVAANPGLSSIRSTGIVTPLGDTVNSALPTNTALSFITVEAADRRFGDAVPPSQKAMRYSEALTIAAHATAANAAARRNAAASDTTPTDDEKNLPEPVVEAVAAAPPPPPLTKAQQQQFDRAHRAILAEFPFLDRTGTSLPPRNLAAPPDVTVMPMPTAADVTRVFGVRGANSRKIYTRHTLEPEEAPDSDTTPTNLSPTRVSTSAGAATRSMRASASMPGLSRPSTAARSSSSAAAAAAASVSPVAARAAIASSPQSDEIPPAPVPRADQSSTVLWEFRDLGSSAHHVRRSVFDNPEAQRLRDQHVVMLEEVRSKQEALLGKQGAGQAVRAAEHFQMHSPLLQHPGVAEAMHATPPSSNVVTTLLPPTALSTLLGADLSASLDLNSRYGRETLAELRFLQGAQIALLADEQAEFKSRMMRDFFIREAHSRIAAQGAEHTAVIVRECALKLRVHLKHLKHQYAVLEADHYKQLTDHSEWVTMEAEARGENRARERAAKKAAAAASKVKSFAIHTGQHLLAAEAHAEELMSTRLALQAVKTRFALYQGAHSATDEALPASAEQQVPPNRTQRRVEPQQVFRTMKPRLPLHDPTPLLNEFESHRPDRPPGHPAFVYLTSFRPPAHALEKLMAAPAISEQTKLIFKNAKSEQYTQDAARKAAKTQAARADRSREQAEGGVDLEETKDGAAGDQARPQSAFARLAASKKRAAEAASASSLTLQADDPDHPCAFQPSRPGLDREELTRERVQWVRGEEAKKARVQLRVKKVREAERLETLRLQRADQGEEAGDDELTALGRRLEGVLANARLQEADTRGTPAEREARAMAAIETEIRAKMALQADIADGKARIDHNGDVVHIKNGSGTQHQHHARQSSVSSMDSLSSALQSFTAPVATSVPSHARKASHARTSSIDREATGPRLQMRELAITKYTQPVGTERERRIKARLQAELEQEVADLAHDPLSFIDSLLPPPTPGTISPMTSGQNTIRSQPKWGAGDASARAAALTQRARRNSVFANSPMASRRVSRMGSISATPRGPLDTPSPGQPRRMSHFGGTSGGTDGGGGTPDMGSPSRLSPNLRALTPQNRMPDLISLPSPAGDSSPERRLRTLRHSQSAMLANEFGDHHGSPPPARSSSHAHLGLGSPFSASSAIGEIEEEGTSGDDDEEGGGDSFSRGSFTITQTDVSAATTTVAISPVFNEPHRRVARPRPAPIETNAPPRKMSVSASSPAILQPPPAAAIVADVRSSTHSSLPSQSPQSGSPVRGHLQPSASPTDRFLGLGTAPNSAHASRASSPLPSSRARNASISGSLVSGSRSPVLAASQTTLGLLRAQDRSARSSIIGTLSSSGSARPSIVVSPATPTRNFPRAYDEASWAPALDERGMPLARPGGLIRAATLITTATSLRAVPRHRGPPKHYATDGLAKPWFSGLNIERDVEEEEEDAAHLAQHAAELAAEQQRASDHTPVGMGSGAAGKPAGSTLISSPTPMHQRELVVHQRELRERERTHRSIGGDMTSRSTSRGGDGDSTARPSTAGPSPGGSARRPSTFAGINSLLQARPKMTGGLRTLKTRWGKVESRLMEPTASSGQRVASIQEFGAHIEEGDSERSMSPQGHVSMRDRSPHRSGGSPNRSPTRSTSGLSSQRSDSMWSDSETGRTMRSARFAALLTNAQNGSPTPASNPFYTLEDLPLSNNIALSPSKWEQAKYSSKPSMSTGEPRARLASAPQQRRRFNDTARTATMALLHEVTADKTLDLHDPLHAPELRAKRSNHAAKLVQYSNLLPTDDADPLKTSSAGNTLALIAGTSKNAGVFDVATAMVRKDTSSVTHVQAQSLTPRTLARRRIYTSKSSVKVNPLSDYALKQWLTAHRKIFKSPLLPQENSSRHGVLFRELARVESPFKAQATAPVDMRDVLASMFSRTGLQTLATPQLRHLEKTFLQHFAGGQRMSPAEVAAQQREHVLAGGAGSVGGRSSSKRADLAYDRSHVGNLSVSQFVQRFLSSDLEEWAKWWTNQTDLAKMLGTGARPSTAGAGPDAKAAAESLPAANALIPLPLWVPAYHRLKILERLMSHGSDRTEEAASYSRGSHHGNVPHAESDLDLVTLWEVTQAEVKSRLAEFQDSSSAALDAIQRAEESAFAARLHRLFNCHLVDMMDGEREAKLDEEEQREEAMVEATHEETMKIALAAYNNTPAGKALLADEARYQAVLKSQAAEASASSGSLKNTSPVRALPSPSSSMSTPRTGRSQLAPLSPSPKRPNSSVSILQSISREGTRQSVAASMLQASDQREEQRRSGQGTGNTSPAKTARNKTAPGSSVPSPRVDSTNLSPVATATPMSAARQRFKAAQRASISMVQRSTRSATDRATDQLFSAVKSITPSQGGFAPIHNTSTPKAATPVQRAPTPTQAATPFGGFTTARRSARSDSEYSVTASEMSPSEAASPMSSSGFSTPSGSPLSPARRLQLGDEQQVEPDAEVEPEPARHTFDVFASIRPATMGAAILFHGSNDAAEPEPEPQPLFLQIDDADEPTIETSTVSRTPPPLQPSASILAAHSPKASTTSNPASNLRVRVLVEEAEEVVITVDAEANLVLTSVPSVDPPAVARPPALVSPSGLSRPHRSLKGIRRRNLRKLQAEERRRVDAQEADAVDRKRSSLTRPLNAASRLLPKPKHADGTAPSLVFVIDPRQEIAPNVDLTRITWSELQAAISTCSTVHERELDEDEQRAAAAERESSDEDDDATTTLAALESQAVERQAALDAGVFFRAHTGIGSDDSGVARALAEINPPPQIESREQESDRERKQLAHRRLKSESWFAAHAFKTAPSSPIVEDDGPAAAVARLLSDGSSPSIEIHARAGFSHRRLMSDGTAASSAALMHRRLRSLPFVMAPLALAGLLPAPATASPNAAVPTGASSSPFDSNSSSLQPTPASAADDAEPAVAIAAPPSSDSSASPPPFVTAVVITGAGTNDPTSSSVTSAPAPPSTRAAAMSSLTVSCTGSPATANSDDSALGSARWERQPEFDWDF